MAKNNLFLGTARGSVGDVTFSRLNGVQVARVRNRSPHNPQSPAQMVQRIIMSTVGKAYSFMSSICDHSFEGFETGQLSQRKFMEVNVGIMRDKVADVLAYPVESAVKSSTAYNFSFKNDYAPVLNEYMISAGSLPSINILQTETAYENVIPFDPGEATQQTITYADIVNLLGVQRGDQLTFVQVAHNGSLSGHDTDVLTGFRYARVILEPASGDMTTPFIGSMQHAVNDPNERNEGEFVTFYISNSENRKGLTFQVKGIASAGSSSDPDKRLAASAVILSRQVGGRWLRSQAILRQNSAANSMNHSTLSLAYETYKMSANSDQYLNQAE